MVSQLRCLPPVGNKIQYKLKPLEDKFFGSYNYCLYQSGTAALAAALTLVKDKNRFVDKPQVLIPAYTCPDIISAAKYAGLTPILIDFTDDKPRLDCEQIISNINNSVIAIIAINFLGISEDISKIRKLVPNNITIIEDSAQNFPVNLENHQWQGDLIISSFGRGKPLSLLGGGILLSRHDDYKDSIISNRLNKSSSFDYLKIWLKVKAYNMLLHPFFYCILTKLTFLNIGNTQLKPLEKINQGTTIISELISHNYFFYKKQQNINQQYSKMLSQLDSKSIIDIPTQCNHDFSLPLLRYPILIKNARLLDIIFNNLNSEGLGVTKMYKTTLPNIIGVSNNDFRIKESINNAELFSTCLITLPTHNRVKENDIKRIHQILNSAITNVDK
jgi:dTDP-4-amino-4,6-dideoxygalactose transaminase